MWKNHQELCDLSSDAQVGGLSTGPLALSSAVVQATRFPRASGSRGLRCTWKKQKETFGDLRIYVFVSVFPRVADMRAHMPIKMEIIVASSFHQAKSKVVGALTLTLPFRIA